MKNKHADTHIKISSNIHPPNLDITIIIWITRSHLSTPSQRHSRPLAATDAVATPVTMDHLVVVDAVAAPATTPNCRTRGSPLEVAHPFGTPTPPPSSYRGIAPQLTTSGIAPPPASSS